MKPTPPNLPPHLLEEAADWFVEFSEGEPDLSTRQQFDTWLRRSPEHVQAYLKITTLWEDTEHLAKARTLASDELVARVLNQGNVVPLVSSHSEPSAEEPLTRSTQASALRPPHFFFAVAATIVLAVLGAGGWLYTQRGTYSTDVGEQRSVRLGDGSVIDLNSRSKIRVRYSEHQRNVELLEGQALFRVAKDKTRPFVAATDNTQVLAVGTQFDVYRKRVGTIVTVVEGRVEVAPVARAPWSKDSAVSEQSRSKEQPVASSTHAPGLRPQHVFALTAGEQLTVSDIIPATAAIQPPAIAPKRVDTTIATAWTQRKITFQGARLGDIVEEFNRYNTRQMVIAADLELETTGISGTFSSTEPDSLLRFLRDLPNFNIEETNDEIRISRNPTSKQ